MFWHLNAKAAKLMFLENLPESHTWFEAISLYWGYIVGFFGALGVLWGFTRKTTKSGWNFYKVVKGFVDTTAALGALTKTVQDGFEEIRAEQAYLNTKFEILSDGVSTPQFRADSHGNFTDVNEAFCALFHKTLDELEGDGWTSIFSGNDRAQSLATWDRATSRKINFSQVLRVVCASNQFKIVKMRARPVFDGHGEFKEYIGSITVLGECE
jgi:PAS domain S-box-containing protein